MDHITKFTQNAITPAIKWKVNREFLLNKCVPETRLPFMWQKKKRAISPRPVRPTAANSQVTEKIPKVSFPTEEDILFYKWYPKTTQGRRENIILRKVKEQASLIKPSPNHKLIKN